MTIEVIKKTLAEELHVQFITKANTIDTFRWLVSIADNCPTVADLMSAIRNEILRTWGRPGMGMHVATLEAVADAIPYGRVWW